MIAFKKNVKKLLPYDRRQYQEFLYDDFNSPTKWYGISFRLPIAIEQKKINLMDFVKIYGRLFENIALRFDDTSLWIVNHDDKDLKWLPKDEAN
jgi:hypothetical protein